MNKFFTIFSAAVMLVFSGCISADSGKAEKSACGARGEVKLLLPERIYAAHGVETNIYFENIVRVINPANYVFEVQSPFGRCDMKRWRYVPSEQDPRSFKLTVRVIGDKGVAAEQDVTVEVAARTAGKDKKISMLIVGDSLTNASVYPRQILDLCNRPGGNPELKLIGSHAGNGRLVKKGGVAHEGYGGWTWKSFLSKWTSDKKFDTLKTRKDILYARSPFLKKGPGRPVLDMKGYFKRANNGKAPDIIVFQLGVNDIFSATDKNVELRIQDIFNDMDKLLSETRKAAPDAVIGVGLPTAGASTQDAFGKSYKSRYFRWQYKKNQHRLVEAMIEKFARHNPCGVELVPVYLNLDCENNFPAVMDNVNHGNSKRIVRLNNGVHPSREGYRQIGDTYYCWLKNVLTGQNEKPAVKTK